MMQLTADLISATSRLQKAQLSTAAAVAATLTSSFTSSTQLALSAAASNSTTSTMAALDEKRDAESVGCVCAAMQSTAVPMIARSSEPLAHAVPFAAVVCTAFPQSSASNIWYFGMHAEVDSDDDLPDLLDNEE
eukprot:15170-Heterococcus_DN1.PRE.1